MVVHTRAQNIHTVIHVLASLLAGRCLSPQVLFGDLMGEKRDVRADTYAQFGHLSTELSTSCDARVTYEHVPHGVERRCSRRDIQTPI